MGKDFFAGFGLLISSLVASAAQDTFASWFSIACSAAVTLVLTGLKIYQLIKKRDSVDISKELEEIKKEVEALKTEKTGAREEEENGKVH